MEKKKGYINSRVGPCSYLNKEINSSKNYVYIAKSAEDKIMVTVLFFNGLDFRHFLCYVYVLATVFISMCYFYN